MNKEHPQDTPAGRRIQEHENSDKTLTFVEPDFQEKTTLPPTLLERFGQGALA